MPPPSGWKSWRGPRKDLSRPACRRPRWKGRKEILGSSACPRPWAPWRLGLEAGLHYLGSTFTTVVVVRGRSNRMLGSLTLLFGARGAAEGNERLEGGSSQERRVFDPHIWIPWKASLGCAEGASGTLGRSEVGRAAREEVEGTVAAHCAPGKGCPLPSQERIK